MNVILALVVIFLAWSAFKLKKLTKSGAITAVFVGFFISYGLGINGLVVLGAFFISSSALSSIFKPKREGLIEEKGSQRDAYQVLANGGVAALISLLHAFNPSAIYQAAFIASLAAANSDTWASEIGKLNKSNPFHVLSFKRVQAGTSGAVSPLGTIAAFAGAAFIALSAMLFTWDSFTWQFPIICGIIVAGFVGNLADTIFGATIQVTYTCEVCGETTERLVHCEQETKHRSGLKWVTNDTVNALCTVMGAVTGAGFAYMIL
ncbi:DUF92 domain-containing protein [Alkalicoccobacillus gibsonii]|uniref:DUF92 domain-containing protein n=1 Tax=Alkalicoccobacillus gibsonii TaxID=79881 RepID=UPI0019317026|nr:DUF92 domain-containing protein [Alkalicoccobacillus gibsonii]MBM0064364.1 DUF92 domain-containing protein [Alkalicoccobacillus gibsonii]